VLISSRRREILALTSPLQLVQNVYQFSARLVRKIRKALAYSINFVFSQRFEDAIFELVWSKPPPGKARTVRSIVPARSARSRRR
jgi:hypothetical protein